MCVMMHLPVRRNSFYLFTLEPSCIFFFFVYLLTLRRAILVVSDFLSEGLTGEIKRASSASSWLALQGHNIKFYD